MEPTLPKLICSSRAGAGKLVRHEALRARRVETTPSAKGATSSRERLQSRESRTCSSALISPGAREGQARCQGDRRLARSYSKARPTRKRDGASSSTRSSRRVSNATRSMAAARTSGPDLSLIGRTERRWIVESLLQPSASVAPHYQAWKIVTTDERTRTGLLVRTYLDEIRVHRREGQTAFRVRAGEVVGSRRRRGLDHAGGFDRSLTDQEIRDLVAYLQSRK